MPADPDESPPPTATPDTGSGAAPAPTKRAARPRAPSGESDAGAPPSPAPGSKGATTDEAATESGPAVPRRAAMDDRTRTLLAVRRSLDQRRPVFGRQAANRYWRIGRDGAWRRPRGLQSKQRRHYGYRPKIVRVGYRSPARVRGLVPSGFRPVIVRTSAELAEIDGRTEAAVIARSVGTRRRLVLEEEAQKLGIRVLNPIVKAEEEA